MLKALIHKFQALELNLALEAGTLTRFLGLIHVFDGNLIGFLLFGLALMDDRLWIYDGGFGLLVLGLAGRLYSRFGAFGTFINVGEI